MSNSITSFKRMHPGPDNGTRHSLGQWTSVFPSGYRSLKATLLVVLAAVLLSGCAATADRDEEGAGSNSGAVPKAGRVEGTRGPTMKVIDTDFSKGRLTLEHEVSLGDLEKFHGHLCDGLVVGFLGIREGLKALYSGGVIDRTNTRIVSKSSPCLTDVAVYLTGGRYQFNSFYVDNSIVDGFYIIQRKDNNRAVKVGLNKGVKPEQIDRLGKRAIQGELSACQLDTLKQMEEAFSEMLLSSSPQDHFTVREIYDFKWAPILKNEYTKTDVLNKNKSQCIH